MAPLLDHSPKSDVSQNAMLNAQNKLRPSLKIPKSGSCWREDIKYFQGNGHKGSVNLSPAWFQQGHDVSVLMCKPYSSAAQSELGNIATTSEGLRELREACCIGLASCYLRVQCDCERNSGCNPPQTLRCGLADYQAPGGYRDLSSEYSNLMGVRFQRCCRYF